MIRVIGFKDNVSVGEMVVNTTSSKNKSFGRHFSPFLLGNNGISLYNSYKAYNVENAWQYSKVYPQFVDEFNEPTEDYFKWAIEGWNKKAANRYPIKKGLKPLYCYWAGEKLDYIEARKKIYIPLYAKEVIKTNAYKQLEKYYQIKKNITLWDFDGYDHRSLNMTFSNVINSEKRKMGHAFILAMLLEKQIEVKNNEVIFNFDINAEIKKDKYKDVICKNISFFD